MTRAPTFNVNYYTHWKIRVRTFIRSYDYKAWRIIEDGSDLPMKMVNGQRVSKPKDEWNDEDIKLYELNQIALHYLFNALSNDEFSRIMGCTSANELYDQLELTYEGANQVKDSKIKLFNTEYENFSMQLGDSIEQMHSMFWEIINGTLGSTRVDL